MRYAKHKAETFVLNLGPQHPATHGVLRIKLTMDGEYIVHAEPVLGYIHRMHEKMAENRTYAQYLPNLARLDYLGAISFSLAHCLIVEKACGIEVPERAQVIRVIMAELNRITSHLLWFGALIVDLGGFTPLLYTFDDREMILDLMDAITGSRLTFCYLRFGGVSADVDDAFISGVQKVVPHMRKRLKMYDSLVTGNPILRERLQGIGDITPDMCRSYGASGAVARGSGVNYDVRKTEPYSGYDKYDFEVPLLSDGDSMARFIVRMKEMEQSLRIIEQAAAHVPAGAYKNDSVPRILKPAVGDFYQAVETPRGAFGIRMVSDGSNTPYRMKLRSPCFSNLSLLPEVSEGMLLADMLAFMGSLDLVIPEIDR
ncbi:MAG: NADH-quinone oxidoreductase subunit D [Spirochaetes bacterium]|nr:NADH-quinone oxidoreductase subunit D [Spirochaetota bacterium]